MYINAIGGYGLGPGDDVKTTVKVNIYGSEYIVKANESPEYIQKLAFMVDKKMQQIGNRNRTMAGSKVAVLTALNLADELCKLREDYEGLLKLIEEAK